MQWMRHDDNDVECQWRG